MSIKITKKKLGLDKRPYAKIYDLKEGRTKQEFTNECDINRLVSKYAKTGEFDNPKGMGMFRDVSEVPNYQSALQLIINARESFRDLDPNLRKRFGNSPQELLEFLKDPKNTDEAIELGLVDAPPAPPNPVLEKSPEKQPEKGDKT